jgi:PKD repeat protein
MFHARRLSIQIAIAVFFLTFSAAAMPVCPFPSYYYDYLTFSGPGCSSSGSTACMAGDSITIQINGSYALQPSCDSVSWTFGDGTTASGTSNTITHTFTQNGRFPVNARISNSSGGGYVNGVAVPVTTIAGCPTRYPDYGQISYTGTNCNSAVYSTVCGFGQPVNFSIAPNYSSYEACDQVTWNFGDGTVTTTPAGVFSVPHTYAAAGSYSTSATISNAFGSAYAYSSSLTYANGTVSLATLSSSYVEGSSVHFLVTRTNATATMSVNYSTTDGSAHAGTDYQAASGTLTFAAGETVKSFDVTTIDDTVLTGGRSFSAHLTGATDGYLIGSGTQTISITDNDYSFLGFSQPSYTATQADGSMVATVLRSGNLANAVTVSYSTYSCCSLPPVQNASGVLNFAPGETAKTITIFINQYDIYIGDSAASITLSNPSFNANFGPSCPYCNPSASLLIKDSNPRPMLSIEDAAIPRPASGTVLVPVTIRLSAPLAVSFSGLVSTADGTAKAGIDYNTVTNAPFTLQPGQLSTTVSIPIIGKMSDDPDKFFKVNLSGFCCSGPTVSKSTAIFTIFSSSASLSPTTQDVKLGASAALTINLGSDPVGPVTVALSSSNAAILDVPDSVIVTSRRTTIELPSKAIGKTTVTATLPPPFNASFDADVRVYAPLNLVLKPDSMSIPVGSSLSVSASFDPPLEKTTSVQLKAANTALVDVPQLIFVDPGKSTSFTMKALKKGATILIATVADLGGQQATFPVEVIDAPKTPTLIQVVPANGPVAGGTNVTLSGANLAANCTLLFGGAPATNVAFVSAGSLTATTPPHPAGAVDVLLTCGSDSFDLTGAFTYLASAPVVSGVAPSFGSIAGGALLRITGSNFRSGCWPLFDNIAAPSATFLSTTEMIGETPAHPAGKVTVALRCSGSDNGALADGFTYSSSEEPAPQIDSVTPLAGMPGQPVTLTGVRFRRDDAVKFDAAGAAIIASAPDADVVRVPEVAPGDVAITLTDKLGRTTTTGPIFSVLEPVPPHVDSVTPTSARPGTDILLDGTGFRPGYSFAFGSARAAVVSLGYTRVLLRVPNIVPATYPLNILNAAGKIASIGPSVTVAATGPSISSVAPACGLTDGGAIMTIRGDGFEEGATVTFDGVFGTIQRIDATTIIVVVPPGAVGSPRIVITNPGGASATLSGAFTVYSPFDPNGGCSGGRSRPLRH